MITINEALKLVNTAINCGILKLDKNNLVELEVNVSTITPQGKLKLTKIETAKYFMFNEIDCIELEQKLIS